MVDSEAGHGLRLRGVFSTFVTRSKQDSNRFQNVSYLYEAPIKTEYEA